MTTHRWLSRTSAGVAGLLLGSLLVIGGSMPAQAAGTAVDTFDTTQSVTVTSGGSNPKTSNGTALLSGGSVLGGERDVFVTRTAGSLTVGFDAFDDGSGNGIGAHSQGASVRGKTLLTYDGVDGDATTLAPTGLGGIDLTSGGVDDTFHVRLLDSDLGGTVDITVYSSATACSSSSASMSGINPQSILLPVSGFSMGAGCTSNANFASAGAVTVLINGTTVSSLDATLDIVEVTSVDHGDLPAAFGITTNAESGARHLVTSGGPVLGATIDSEADGLPSAGANGDDTAGTPDDEDGVVVTSGFAWSTGGGGKVDVTATGDGLLSAWIDFDHDFDFADAGEKIFDNFPVSAGTVTIPFAIPGGTTLPGDFFSRFRLFLPEDSPPARSPSGPTVVGGEVEDHLLNTSPDITVSKTDGVTTASPGDSLTYTVTISNVGSAGATGVVATDTIPANTSYSSSSDLGVFAAGTVTWPSFSLAAGSFVTRTVTVSVNATVPSGATSLTNSASAADDGSNGADPTPSNNSATDVDTLDAQPDLTISKSDSLTNVEPGDTVTYTLTINNVGNQDATGVTVTDTIPANTTFVSASDGGTHLAGVVTYPAFSLAAGAFVTRTVTVTVNDPLTGGVNDITNSASVNDDGTNGADPTPGNNTATDTDTVDAQPDLTVTKTDGVASASPGDTLTYTITVCNVGNQNADNVAITDTIPANTSFVSASDGGTFSAGVVSWPTFGIGATGCPTRSVTVLVNASVPAGVVSITNTANAADDGTNGADPTPGNNTGTDIDTLVAQPDLTITKDDSLTTVMPGDVVTYTLTITNNGNQGATGVTVTDTIPANTNYVSSSNGGLFAAGVVTYPTFSLAAGATVTRTVTVQVIAAVPAGVTSITNNASVSDDGANGSDPNPGDNTASDTDALAAQPDITVTKTDGVTSTTPGSTLTYTLTISNVGSQGATGVLVTDAIPANTTFSSASAGGLFAAGTVTWPAFPLAAGAIATRTVTVTVNSPLASGVSSITNTANANDDGSNGADPTPANNSATDTDTVNASPDLTITKTDGVSSTTPGSTLTYTLTISNVGNQNATGVVVLDSIPGYTTFSSASDGGTFFGGIVTFPAFPLAGGATVTRTVTVVVDSTVPSGVTSLTNATSVSDDGSNGADPTTGNNSASDTDTLNATPDLTITKDDARTTVSPGDTWTYTLTINNTGTQGATGVVITDTIPPGTSFVSASNSGTFAAGVVTYPTISLAAGAMVNRTVTVKLPLSSGGGDGAVAAGYLFTCMLQSDSTVKCTGYNGSGQLGDNTTTRRLTPVSVIGLSGVTAITAGRDHACALLSAGTVKCWGNNGYGQLGDNTTTQRLTPVTVSGLSGVKAISAGFRHTCALLTSGGIKCWGDNTNNQIGDGTTTRRLVPTSTTGITTAIGVAAGSLHNCAVLTGGTMKCWGDNQNGPLGDGTTTRRSTPVAVSGITNAKQADGGDSHTCAVLTTGAVKCWGRNNDGQLGNGTTTDSTTPVTVSGLSGANYVSAGGFHSCARIAADGSLRCWGNNTDGRLGDNSTIRRLTPVMVFGLTGVTSFSAGGNHTCALLSTGEFKCFGNNTQGQFGDGTKTNSDKPTHMNGSTGPTGTPSSVTNTAHVADDGSNGSDPTPANNTATDTDTVV